jgi:hypothetical protein
MACPEIDRRLVSVLPEKSVEMGRIFERETVGNFFGRVSGLCQQGFCFVEELLMDEMAGRLAGTFLYDGTQVVWVHQELACIKVNRFYFVADFGCRNMTLYGLMES